VTDFKDSNAVKNPAGPRAVVSPPRIKRVQQLHTAHNISNSNRARADKTPYDQKPQMQRKCLICSSPSHLQSACPRKISSGMKTGSPDVRSARVNACSIGIGDDRQRVNTACGITRDAHVMRRL